jgi:hypothetical protein
MAAALSKYEGVAEDFLTDHPVGTTVPQDRLVGWATRYKDGLASDLLIDSPGKQFSALRRHINDGAASRNFDEDRRFHLAVIDAKRKTCVVRLLSEHVSEQADAALGKSVRGAITPIKSAQKALDDVKVDELSDEQRAEIEQRAGEMLKLVEPVQKMFSVQIIDYWTGRLIAKGMTEQQAQTTIAMLPMMTPVAKLLKLTK